MLSVHLWNKYAPVFLTIEVIRSSLIIIGGSRYNGNIEIIKRYIQEDIDKVKC